MRNMSARLRDYMPMLDRFRYLSWRLTRQTKPITVHLSAGLKLRMRQWPAMDISTACEVFVQGSYDPPDGIRMEPDSVHRVIDLGANTGYTCLLWSVRYPKAHVEAFEPHPVY